MEGETSPSNPLHDAREEFVSQWGTLGSAWGINRTMAQIHALLMTSPRALSTDEVMEALQVSRGNANTNLRDLVGWGLIRVVLRKGDRKEYFESEKDVWKMFCTISRERRRREISPATEVVARCAENTKGLKDPDAKAFHDQMERLLDFLKLAERVSEAVASSEKNFVIKLAAKLFSR